MTDGGSISVCLHVTLFFPIEGCIMQFCPTFGYAFKEFGGYLCFRERHSVPFFPTLKMETAASPETMVTIYQMSNPRKVSNIPAIKSSNLIHFHNLTCILIMYFSTIQSNIIFPSSILLASILTLSKQNFMLLSSIAMHLPIPPNYITR